MITVVSFDFLLIMEFPMRLIFIVGFVSFAAVKNCGALKCVYCNPLPGTGQCGNITEQFCELQKNEDVCVKIEGVEKEDGKIIFGILERGCASLATLRNHSAAAEQGHCHTVSDAQDLTPLPGAAPTTFTGTICVCSANLCNTAVKHPFHTAFLFLPVIFRFLW